MNKNIILFSFILYATGCGSIEEFEKKEFQMNYQNCIQIVLLKNIGCEIEFYDLAKAYDVLDCLTQRESKAPRGNDIPYCYSDSKHLNDDLEAWFGWLNNEGTDYTMKKANDIFKNENKDKIKSENDTLREKKKKMLGVSEKKMKEIEDLELISWPRIISSPNCRYD